ncbi:MAG: hypothetical protein HN909_05370 [Phycisphaerales bacterium]|jgi:hypothetical protein|nr:hypothetical protein [Phycisphaerales bacterium]MBT7171183.1 hypothetical protein [Phycisphaerales bacterium]
MKRKRNQSGLTLVELLWAMVGTSIIMLGLAAAMDATLYVYGETTEQQRLQQSSRIILDTIKNDIRIASDATKPGESMLQLKFIADDGATTFTTYSVVNGGLVREQDGDTIVLMPGVPGRFLIEPFDIQLLREYVPILDEDGDPTTELVTIVVRLDVVFCVGDKSETYHSSTALRQNY